MSDSGGTLRIKKSELETLFAILRRDSKGTWKRKTEAANKTGLSRTTIDKILKAYPHGLPSKPKLGEGKYVDAFENSESWQKLKDHKYAGEIRTTLKEAFRLLGNTEPKTWSVDDLKDLRKPTVTRRGVTRQNVLYKANTQDIAPNHATNIRRAFDDLNLTQIHITGLKDVEKGFTATRQEWYLREDSIKAVIQNVNDVETLMFTVLELQCGARPISMVQTKVDDLKFGESPPYMSYFESKNQIAGQRYFIPDTWRLIQRYISDLGLAKNQRLFKAYTQERPQDYFSDRFKEAGVRAGIELFEREGAAMYVLRHTFATQARDHDVSLEVVMKQGGWTEASTLMKHYIFVKKSKMTRELGAVSKEESEKTIPFGDWLKQFVPVWEQRYNELRAGVKA